MRHERFEWDAEKAAARFAKHRVKFDHAANVLADPFAERFHIEEFDAEHSSETEDRWITTGSDPVRRSVVLVISWTTRRDTDGRPATRIISARTATRRERSDYEKEIRKG